MTPLRLTRVEGRFVACRLEPDAALPEWAGGTFCSITRTSEELSIICDEAGVPPHIRCERGWRALRVEGPLPFELTGVAAALTSPLSEAGISLLLIATFDTDYLLTKEENLTAAETALRNAGHLIA